VSENMGGIVIYKIDLTAAIKLIKLKSVFASNVNGISLSYDEKYIYAADSYAGLRIYDI
jgi:hypothetical protein